MLKVASLASLALLVAAASAQTGMNVIRSTRQVDVTDLEAELVRIEMAAKDDVYNETVSATERMYAAMAQMSADTQLANAEMQNGINSMLDSLNTQMAVQNTAMSTAMENQATSLTSQMASLQAQMSTAEEESGDTMEELESTLISRSVAANTQTDGVLAAINRTMLSAMGNKASEYRHVWLGGCSSHNHGCWQDFCLNRVEVDTARPYFQKASNTRMRTLQTGFFRMNSYFMGTHNWQHIQMMVNNQRMRYTYEHTWQGWWKSNYDDATFFIPANQEFWFKGCGHYHNMDNSHHQRQEFSWIGTRAQ